MAESDTLLAHIIPQLPVSTEDIATKSLAYILNASPAALGAFNALVQPDGVEMEPICRVATQVVAPDKTRPDFVGYDKFGGNRLIGESKFWHALMEHQVTGYLEQLADDGPATLLFVAPGARIDTLWRFVERQAGETGKELESLVSPNLTRWAKVAGTESYLMLVSWPGLLDNLETRTTAAGDLGTSRAIQELRGLALLQDSRAFLPLHPDELNPEVARRLKNFYTLCVAASDRALAEGAIDSIGRFDSATNYSGRGIGVSGIEAWLGTHHRLWASGDCDDTPMWLWLSNAGPDLLNKVSAQLGLRASGKYFPILLKTGVEESEVITNMVSQLKAIAEAIKAAQSSP